jgi:hypothetical protein
MIDISELVTDPDFAQDFDVIRYTGAFASEGVYTQTPGAPLRLTGSIQPASAKDTVQFQREGERLGNMITVFCDQELQASDAKGQNSDVIVWRGSQYRVVQCRPWVDFGYWQVMAEGLQNV